MFCKKCGNKLLNNDEFCSKCGAESKVEKVDTKNTIDYKNATFVVIGLVIDFIYSSLNNGLSYGVGGLIGGMLVPLGIAALLYLLLNRKRKEGIEYMSFGLVFIVVTVFMIIITMA